MAGPTVKAIVAGIDADLPNTLTEEQRTAVLQIHEFILSTPSLKGVRSIERAKIRNAAGLHRNRVTKTGQEIINSRLGIISPKTGLVNRLHEVSDARAKPVQIDSNFSAAELGFTLQEWVWLCIPGTFNPWLGLAGKVSHKASASKRKRKAPSSESNDADGETPPPSTPPRSYKRAKRSKRRSYARYADSDDTDDEGRWDGASEAASEGADFSDDPSEKSTDREASTDTLVAASTKATTPSSTRSKQSSIHHHGGASPLVQKRPVASNTAGRENITDLDGLTESWESPERGGSPVDDYGFEPSCQIKSPLPAFTVGGDMAAVSSSRSVVVDSFLPDFELDDIQSNPPGWPSASRTFQSDLSPVPAIDITSPWAAAPENVTWPFHAVGSTLEATGGYLDENNLWWHDGDGAHGALLADMGLKMGPVVQWTAALSPTTTATDGLAMPSSSAAADPPPRRTEEPGVPVPHHSPLLLPVIRPSDPERVVLTRDDDVVAVQPSSPAPDLSQYFLSWDAELTESIRDMLREVSYAEGVDAIAAFYRGEEEEDERLLGEVVDWEGKS